MLPHWGTVQIDTEPFVSVEIERVDQFDAFEQMSVLGADRRAPCIRCVHVQPDSEIVTHHAQLY